MSLNLASVPEIRSAENDPLAAVQPRRIIVATFVMMLYQGYMTAINGIASPWIAAGFGLGESGIARLYAWISLSAVGALVISRYADRVGRRRVLLSCMTATPLLALGAALSTNVVAFTIFDIAVYACATATISSSVVLIAEGLPIELRAKGQSYGGLALGLGGGICVVLVPILSDHEQSWRWLLFLAGSGILLIPYMRRAIPESARWQHAAASGATKAGRFYDMFAPAYRGRAIPVLLCSLLSMTAVTAVTSWGYFHAVSVNKLSPAAASLMTIIGGGLSFAGLAGGAWSAERFGRVPTVSAAGVLLASGGLFFYWGPPQAMSLPAVWLGAGFGWFMIAVNAWMVAGNSAATELFPTALRSTMLGWLALVQAIASVTCQAVIALTAEAAGGLSVVVGYIALLAVPSAILFALTIEETRGLSLEAAAREQR
ncbi:MAG: MFS transporter [Deltaproteobacteria bacterium]|nr:MFS transporter [Deltaproteobacteria bacterium]